MSSDVKTELKNLIESINERPAYPDYIIMSQKNINQIKNVYMPNLNQDANIYLD